MKDVSPHFLFDVDELIIISSSSHPSAQMSLDELILFMGGLPAAAGETMTLAGDKKCIRKRVTLNFFVMEIMAQQCRFRRRQQHHHCDGDRCHWSSMPHQRQIPRRRSGRRRSKREEEERTRLKTVQEQVRAIRKCDKVIRSLEGERSRWKGEFANLEDIGWCLCYSRVDFDWLWKDEKCQQIWKF